MNKTEELFEKFRTAQAIWEDYELFITLNETQMEPFYQLANEIKNKHFKNVLKIYIPNKRFPAISITGTDCSLHCDHCNEKYLAGMKPLQNNADLEKFLFQHAKNDGVGALISGGCDPDGSVPLINFLDTIKKVKNASKLIINTHTGLLNEQTAKKLSEANVDIVSFDVNMDEEIVKKIYHLDKELEEYKRAVNLLKKYNLNIIPHICVGLHYGELHKELNSLRFIKEAQINPELIVIIALIPPKNSKISFRRPEPSEISKIILLTRFIFPTTEISLGCMRPRGDIKIEVEKYAINAGITRIEIPSVKTLEWLKERDPSVRFKFFSACCAIPRKYEKIAKSKESDIKRYLII